MAFLRCTKPISCKNPYRRRLGFDILRRVRKLQGRSPSACCSRGCESRCGPRIAKQKCGRLSISSCRARSSLLSRQREPAAPRLCKPGCAKSMTKSQILRFHRRGQLVEGSSGARFGPAKASSPPAATAVTHCDRPLAFGISVLVASPRAERQQIRNIIRLHSDHPPLQLILVWGTHS